MARASGHKAGRAQRNQRTSRMSTACVDSNCSSWGSDMMARGMRLEAKEGSRSARMARCSTDACTASTPPLVSPCAHMEGALLEVHS
eukprot:1136428-Pelagomonas_calceolata.AAC.4